MAIPIQNPLVGSVLHRAFALQGRVAPQLEEFVVPTVSLGDLSLSLGPSVVRHAAAVINMSPVVGERPILRFESIPATICVVRSVSLRTGTANNWTVHFPGTAAVLGALATVSTKSFTDGRLLPGTPSGAQRPSGVLTTGTQVAAFATNHFQTTIPAEGLVYRPPGGWVVGTGHPSLTGFLEMQVVGTNLTVAGGLEWDEYQVL